MSTEAEWVASARAGDQAAFRRLYDAHAERVFRLAFRIVGDDDLARDLTQEAFVRAFRKLDQFRNESAFGTWLHAIAASVALDGARRRALRMSREIDLDPEVGPASPPCPPDVGLSERLHRAIDDLPGRYRVVFLMHDLEGFSHLEIAGALGIAEGTSKARLSRARAKLREVLGPFEEYVR